MAYIGIPPFGQTIRSITSTTATSGQTTFNITGGYVVGYVDVFLNGILLTPSDYTATDGLSVVLASGAATGDEFQALAYQPVSLVDTYRKSEVDSAISAAVAGVDLSSKVSKTGDTMTGPLVTPMVVTDSSMNFRNRIINGDMRINQRGFSGSPGLGAYMLDRYFYNANAQRITVSQSTDAPAGFTNSMLVTSSAAASIGVNDYTNISQIIEGNNISDLAWGSASAKTITISFWVKSSLTGTFGGALRNTATTGSYYGYPFTYTISAANTWEYKTITIVGPTSTSYFWDTNTNRGIWVWFDFGTGTTYTNTAGSWVQQNIVGASGTTKLVETNGATWRMTGLQFEVGSVATPFERRPYGTELALCSRYFTKAGPPNMHAFRYNSTISIAEYSFGTQMRASPTVTLSVGAGTVGSPATSIYGWVVDFNDTDNNFILSFTASAEL